MQVPILSGITTDTSGDYRTEYPRNMTPIPKDQGVSNGYLRPSEGILPFSDTKGRDKGGINWNGICYRVIGSNFVRVLESGAVQIVSAVEVNGTDNVTFTYSFSHLAVATGGKLYLYDGTTFARVTDVNLMAALDVVWMDGYFFTTDGEFIVATSLNDPFAVNPFSYGSSEIDPDPIVGVKKLRNELIGINRYSVEYFDNVGVTGVNSFPLQRISGAELQKGCVGTHASAIFSEALAFVGGSLNEEPAVWVGRSGSTAKLSTREVDLDMRRYSEAVLSKVIVEARRVRNHDFLYIHLPDQTWVYDASASTVLQRPVWFTLDSGLDVKSRYSAFNFTYCYGKWITGDPNKDRLGVMTDNTSHHYGNVVWWGFGTTALYNEGNGAIVHEIKLTGLTGRVALGKDPYIVTQYSDDGLTWSQPKRKRVGKIGDRARDMTWFSQGTMRETRMQRFQGTSDAFVSFARLDMKLEGLSH